MKIIINDKMKTSIETTKYINFNLFQKLSVCKTFLFKAARPPNIESKFILHNQNISLKGALPVLLQNPIFIEDQICRFYSNQKNPGFISKFIDNIKQDMQKNKEMKESLKKFREEAEKLEQSEALKSARQKFQTVESEANKSSEVLKEKMEDLKGKVCNYYKIFILH
jgi:hypothetical protein